MENELKKWEENEVKKDGGSDLEAAPVDFTFLGFSKWTYSYFLIHIIEVNRY